MPSSSLASYFGSTGFGERNVDRFFGVQPWRRSGGTIASAWRSFSAIVVGDAGFSGVHFGATEFFGADHFAGRGLHQRRAAEEDGALVAHDDGLVRHRRHVSAARRARAHDHGDLRNAGGRQRRLIVKDAAEMLAVGKHLGLMRQVGAAGIDQIDAGQPVLARDLLRAQMLLHRHRVVGAALDGGVVADDHAFAAGHAADAGDDAGAMDGIVVHAVGGERRQFEKRRAGIDQRHHALARQQLAAREMTLAGLRRCRPRQPWRVAPQAPRRARASPPDWRGTHLTRHRRLSCDSGHESLPSGRDFTTPRGRATACNPLGADFLALEHHVAGDEQHDDGGDHRHHLRPCDQYA